MQQIRQIEFEAGSREERLPGFAPDFPYIATRAELDRYAEQFVPWHWHRAVELFYMESGALEYETPAGRMVFPKGSGGFVNSNVLHMTRPLACGEENLQLVHLFDPSFIAGEQGSRIGQKYVLPLTAAAQVELIPRRRGLPQRAGVLPPLPGLPAYHPGRVHHRVPAAGRLPDAGRQRPAGGRGGLGLRPWQQQPLRQRIPPGDGLHPHRIPPPLAGSRYNQAGLRLSSAAVLRY